jgi:hypothetical protein
MSIASTLRVVTPRWTLRVTWTTQMQAWEMTRSAGCMHLSVGAGLLANAVVLLWACLLDVDRSHPPC